MDLYPIKPRLLELLQHNRKELLLFVDGLSDAEREQPGAQDAWSPKDLFAHLLSWQERTVGRLDAALTGETPPPSPADDLDTLNARYWSERQDQSWDALLDAARLLYQDISEKVSRISEQDLSEPDRFPWLNGRPLWMSVAFEALIHPQTHLFGYYQARGNRQGMDRQIDTVAASLKGVDDRPAWRGMVLYNLACLHALSGQPRKALTLLPEALHLRPDLKGWAKQDPDLTSLHQDAAFLKLVAEEQPSK